MPATSGYPICSAAPFAAMPYAAHRGKGIARACCARAVHEILARGHRHVFLSARKDGLPAKKVYEPIGFRFARGLCPTQEGALTRPGGAP
jgi:ribosomal protein S18 acetylase RimI-like enzyme